MFMLVFDKTHVVFGKYGIIQDKLFKLERERKFPKVTKFTSGRSGI